MYLCSGWSCLQTLVVYRPLLSTDPCCLQTLVVYWPLLSTDPCCLQTIHEYHSTHHSCTVYSPFMPDTLCQATRKNTNTFKKSNTNKCVVRWRCYSSVMIGVHCTGFLRLIAGAADILTALGEHTLSVNYQRILLQSSDLSDILTSVFVCRFWRIFVLTSERCIFDDTHFAMVCFFASVWCLWCLCFFEIQRAKPIHGIITIDTHMHIYIYT